MYRCFVILYLFLGLYYVTSFFILFYFRYLFYLFLH